MIKISSLHSEAPAKINLGLHILRKRIDGYHDLATVFHRISWADKLTALSAEKLSMTCTDHTLSCGDDNLVMRAAKLLQRTSDVNEGASMHLEKNLPHGAGIGGGSSDAATVLLMLCELWKLNKAAIPLDSLALQLGSDVPFFLHHHTAYAEGRGEELAPMTGYHFPFSLAVIVQPIHISTQWAFRQVDVSEENRADLVEIVASNDLERWRYELVNDFEEPVFSHWPQLREVKSHLLRSGAGFAGLTGSGSGVYGVFESYEDANEAAMEAREDGCSTWCQPSVRP
ncbi:MAG: 4-(cytidine 5'-diphospho)-2-C-methyl-D-erythritol kinase [Bacteroidetes bacterium]|nr:4-(cytidine 5'-diphospho)-2-C-methyl-D-erythritol kinase [Bacteroidota bacterium]MCY4204513.1 4-(cytidine 5'-diphospho)-2-C-methyl-D-erythritol kinase [Bacteroidota bacterium]